MNTIEVAGKTYTVKFEFPNGAFYLEGPRGGCAIIAKEAKGSYYFYPVRGTSPIRSAGSLVTATREQLAA
jgi:hypothetical protein